MAKTMRSEREPWWARKSVWLIALALINLGALAGIERRSRSIGIEDEQADRATVPSMTLGATSDGRSTEAGDPGSSTSAPATTLSKAVDVDVDRRAEPRTVDLDHRHRCSVDRRRRFVRRRPVGGRRRCRPLDGARSGRSHERRSAGCARDHGETGPGRHHGRTCHDGGTGNDRNSGHDDITGNDRSLRGSDGHHRQRARRRTSRRARTEAGRTPRRPPR